MLLILANGLVYYSLVHVMLFLAENYTVTHCSYIYMISLCHWNVIVYCR